MLGARLNYFTIVNGNYVSGTEGERVHGDLLLFF